MKSISPELVTGQVPVSLEIALAVVGLFVGGLMNAVADRIPPLDPEYDGPFIAEQNRPLKWWEFLPFLSMIGARQAPRMKIKNGWWRYPALELGTALGFWLSASRFDDNVPVMIAASLFSASLVALAFIDFETKYLPFKLVWPTGIAALAFAPFWPDLEWWQPLAGAAAGFMVFYPIYLLGIRLNRPLMGGGDAYLAAAMGAMLGIQMLFLGLYIGVVIGGLAATVVLFVRMAGKGQQVIAYGPYLSMGGLVALFFGRSIIDWIVGA